jgi:hypothetical protein
VEAVTDKPPNMVHISNDTDPDGLWLAVFPHRDTGEPTPMMQLAPNSLDMWLAISDGVAVVTKGDEDAEMVMAPFEWCRRQFGEDVGPALDKMEATLRQYGMLP